MAAYLVIDVDDLLTRLQTRSFAVDMHDLATRLRGNAALAAGLPNPDALKAIAVADWEKYRSTGNATLERIFEGVGLETFTVASRPQIVDQLIMQYFGADPKPVDELILVTNELEIIGLMDKIKLHRHGRVRVWA